MRERGVEGSDGQLNGVRVNELEFIIGSLSNGKQT